jgi:hypothetical protein
MNIDYIIQLIKDGHDIEFEYGDKRYSITHGNADNTPIISFCQFGKQPTNVKDIDDLLEQDYNGATVADILDCLT